MTARQHHWVPQCYLKGFGKSRSKKAKLFVVDLAEKRTFETTPRNVGGERDFNRVDVRGVDPDAVENRFSPFETRLATVFKETIDACRIPSDEAKQMLLNGIALFAARNPRNRAMFQSALQQTRIIIDDLVEQHRAAGEPVKADPLPDWSTTEQVSAELKLVAPLMATMADRNWHLLHAKEGHFVTSDHPVTLYWSDAHLRRTMPPGFALRGDPARAS